MKRIQAWVKQKIELKTFAEQGEPHAKRMKGAERKTILSEELEVALEQWVFQQRAVKLRVTRKLLRFEDRN